MKKILLSAIVSCILFSCTKSKVEPPKPAGAYWFQCTSVDIDGKTQESKAVFIRF